MIGYDRINVRMFNEKIQIQFIRNYFDNFYVDTIDIVQIVTENKRRRTKTQDLHRIVIIFLMI